MSKLINPRKYTALLNGSLACNYSLNSRTMYRSMDMPEGNKANIIEAFYKYKMGEFNIDWAFRSFDNEDDYREYKIIMVTDKGIYRDEISRTVYDEKIYMRWTTFVTKLQERPNPIFITTAPGSKKIMVFKPVAIYKEYRNKENQICKVDILDTKGLHHIMKATDQLMYALLHKTDYIDIDETNYIPINNFNMWYMIF